MPMNRALYPDNWDEIAFAIKQEADWNCAECGRPCLRPGESFDELRDRISGTDWASDLFEQEETEEFGLIEVPKPGRFVLSVAHLNHIPEDCRRENLKELCSVCHCRYDLKAMATKRRLKQERLGQMTIDFGGVESA